MDHKFAMILFFYFFLRKESQKTGLEFELGFPDFHVRRVLLHYTDVRLHINMTITRNQNAFPRSLEI